MAKNFFELVNNDFFQILNGKYKEVNYELLTLINREMNSDNGSLEKEKLIRIIRHYFDMQPILFSFDYDDNGNPIDFKKNPAELLNWYKRTGWLTSEASSNFKEVYQMEPVAIQILTAMEDAVKADDRPIESTGYVHAIFDGLTSIDTKDPSSVGKVEQLGETSSKLNNNLRMVNSKIKKYLNNLLKQDRQEPKKILKELLLNYQDNVVAKSFNNLWKKDNPSKYKDVIIKNIKILQNERFDELVDNYIEVKCNGHRNEETLLEARTFYNDIFRQIKQQFETIDQKLSLLASKNSQYVSSARSRVNFLLNDKENLEGRINDILRNMEVVKVDNDDEFDFNLYELGRIDDSSLYVHQRSKKTEDTYVNDDNPQLTEEQKKHFHDELVRLSRFTMSGVDNFIMSMLGEKDVIQAKDIPLESTDDFMILFLARLYEQHKAVHYNINELDDLIIYNNKELKNFEIKRRKHK